jgi:uncharacterized membrane protein YqjE
MQQGVFNRVAASAATLADHFGAYAEIMVIDLEASTRNATARLCAAAVLGVAAAFTLAIGCTWLIAATWNTPAHVPVMIGLLLLGALLGLGAWLALGRYRRSAPPLLAHTLAEWAKDRRLIEELFNAGEEVDP